MSPFERLFRCHELINIVYVIVLLLWYQRLLVVNPKTSNLSWTESQINRQFE